MLKNGISPLFDMLEKKCCLNMISSEHNKDIIY